MVLYNHRSTKGRLTKQADTPAKAGFIITDRKENIMKLTGYYMTAVTKFADGIKTIIVFGVRTREELVKALNAAHPDEKIQAVRFQPRKVFA